jgi:poly(3-hydroxybutyrate) depolymerase
MAAACICLAAPPSRAEVLHKQLRVDGTRVDYQVVLPKGYQASKAYPAVLAFGGGPQSAEIDERILAGTYRDEAERRGYIVVMPDAPGGRLFFEGGERVIPGLLQRVLADYHVQGGKFRIAGMSNGGISAFHIAALYPQYFVSITAFPGYLPEPTAARLAAISKMCIHMFVGQYDELGFDKPMQQEAAVFRQRGFALTYSVEKGQTHRIRSLSGAGAARLFDQFDQDRHGCTRD